MRRHGYWRIRSLLYLMLLAAGCIAIGCVVRIRVLEVGEGGSLFRVADGEVFSLTYTHSMYNVSVTEKFRVENGQLTLFHVVSSDAALEYFGIDKKEENNVRRNFVEFLIPRASIGKHVIRIRDNSINLNCVHSPGEKVRVRLVQVPFIIYASQIGR